MNSVIVYSYLPPSSFVTTNMADKAFGLKHVAKCIYRVNIYLLKDIFSWGGLIYYQERLNLYL